MLICETNLGTLGMKILSRYYGAVMGELRDKSTHGREDFKVDTDIFIHSLIS